MKNAPLIDSLFSVPTPAAFKARAIAIFRFQYEKVTVYRQFCKALNCKPEEVTTLEDIPFLPVQFFKSHQVGSYHKASTPIFTSSGTTGSRASKHYVPSLKLYERAFRQGFTHFYGSIKDYIVLALLPSYLERKGSSLIYMVRDFINESGHPESGFYLHDYAGLAQKLSALDQSGKKVLLIGISFALLDLIECQNFNLRHTLVMETGGMKGRRKEMTRPELHQKLKRGFGVPKIHSEYGMTELLSQAYSQGDGLFRCAPTMQILIREPEDPFHYLPQGKTGGVNIIDLANLYSCSFIATQDLGKKHDSETLEILGRFDHSDIRGCNLMVL